MYFGVVLYIRLLTRSFWRLEGWTEAGGWTGGVQAGSLGVLLTYGFIGALHIKTPSKPKSSWDYIYRPDHPIQHN